MKKVFNGMLGEIKSISTSNKDPLGLWYEVEIALDGEDYPYSGFIFRKQFGSSEALSSN